MLSREKYVFLKKKKQEIGNMSLILPSQGNSFNVLVYFLSTFSTYDMCAFDTFSSIFVYKIICANVFLLYRKDLCTHPE